MGARHGADLTMVNLTNADLRGANLTGADLSYARLLGPTCERRSWARL